ncbi:uncharacterized protein LOC134251126 [Saccostrea cucullata]|uniref:uncharacterized protein LOC134251126 n=1 Tax=Saccostrea cuccullata TaxID=36930 RepID=UPI002ED2F1C6
MLKKTARVCLHFNLNVFHVRKASQIAYTNGKWYEKYLGEKITFDEDSRPEIKKCRPDIKNTLPNSLPGKGETDRYDISPAVNQKREKASDWLCGAVVRALDQESRRKELILTSPV